MSKIIGVTVGTPISPETIRKKLKAVTSVNNITPDKNGNVKLPSFDGEYEITPSTVGDQTLLTGSKYMDANLKVLKIPYAEVTNNQGGSTVTIGNEV